MSQRPCLDLFLEEPFETRQESGAEFWTAAADMQTRTKRMGGYLDTLYYSCLSIRSETHRHGIFSFVSNTDSGLKETHHISIALTQPSLDISSIFLSLLGDQRIGQERYKDGLRLSYYQLYTGDKRHFPIRAWNLIENEEFSWGHIADDEAILQRAVESNSSSAFGVAVDTIEWEFADESLFEQAITGAIRLDCDSIAWKLAKQGSALYPNNTKLSRAARVLAPAKTIKRKTVPIKGLSASVEWFERNAEHYKGLWVAVEKGQLIATDSTRQGLEAQLATLELTNPIVEKIPLSR